MKIPLSNWYNYISKLAAISKEASRQMQEHSLAVGYDNAEALIDYAYALATKYGEATAALACEMYDAIAEAQKAGVPPAEPAPTATYGETAKAVYGTLKNKQNTVPATVGRLVKQVGADTMLQNAKRDHAQFAWIPMGDTCAFCLTLASRGWQYQSAKTLKNGHAEHIHANCNCEYCIRFDGKSTVEGYDPEALEEKYYSFEGTPDEKINAWRRENYAANPEKYREQKRIAYANRKKIEFAKDPLQDDGLPLHENSGIILSKPSEWPGVRRRMILRDDVPEHRYTPEQIIEELKTSEIGQITLERIEQSKVIVEIIDEVQGHSNRGEQQGEQIRIFSLNNNKLLHEAQSVIHEMTHYWYNIGECQHAEAICYAMELMHSRKKMTLTRAEWEMIVDRVKEAYTDYKWEDGGYGDFTQFNFVT